MGSRVFLNVPEDNSVVNVIDRSTGQVVTKWGLNGVKANYPMALDEDNHRLFVVTRRPPFVMVLDTDMGKSLPERWCRDLATTSISIPSASASTRWAAKGLISVIQQNDPDHYALITDIPTTVGVRTGTFFGTSLYVGVPASRLEPAQIWNYQVPE